RPLPPCDARGAGDGPRADHAAAGRRGGTVVVLTAGDVLVIPAGTSHARPEHSSDSWMVGGYPEGRDRDPIRDEAGTEAAAPSARRARRRPADPGSRPGPRRADDAPARGAAEMPAACPGRYPLPPAPCCPACGTAGVPASPAPVAVTTGPNAWVGPGTESESC